MRTALSRTRLRCIRCHLRIKVHRTLSYASTVNPFKRRVIVWTFLDDVRDREAQGMADLVLSATKRTRGQLHCCTMAIDLLCPSPTHQVAHVPVSRNACFSARHNRRLVEQRKRIVRSWKRFDNDGEAGAGRRVCSFPVDASRQDKHISVSVGRELLCMPVTSAHFLERVSVFESVAALERPVKIPDKSSACHGSQIYLAAPMDQKRDIWSKSQEVRKH